MSNSQLGDAKSSVIELAKKSLASENHSAGAAYALSRLDPDGPGGKLALAYAEKILGEARHASAARTSEIVAAALNLKSAQAPANMNEYMKGYSDQLRRGAISRLESYPDADVTAAYLLWLEAEHPTKLPEFQPGLRRLRDTGCLRLQTVARRLSEK